MSIHPFGIKTN